MNCHNCQKIHGGSCNLVNCDQLLEIQKQSTTIVRKNILTVAHYTPYCGAVRCRKGMIRTKFDKALNQFVCDCGWVSEFQKDFIDLYLKIWGI